MGGVRTVAVVVSWAAAAAIAGASFAQGPVTQRGNGLQASVSALGYEQALSFFVGRGLPTSLMETYARQCVLSVALHNQASDGTVSLRLSDWRVRQAAGVSKVIRGRAGWLATFDGHGLSVPARMAFEWSQLPEEAQMSAGDSIQGMLSVPIARDGSAFDLIVRWRSGKVEHELSIEQIRCT